MILSFRLSMPNVGSWNGKWTASERNYVLCRKVSKEDGLKILESKSYYYNFGDGWGASIAVQKIDGKEAAKIRRHSDGFSSYEWMIDTIILYGEILNTSERKEKATSE